MFGSVLCFHTWGSFHTRFLRFSSCASGNDRVGGCRSDDLQPTHGVASPQSAVSPMRSRIDALLRSTAPSGRREKAGLLLVLQSIAFTLDHERVAVMQQTIENGGREDLVPEDGAPLRHDLVRGDEQTPAFVPTRDQLEEQMRAAAFERQVPELVDNQQLRLAVKQQALSQLALGFGFGQGREQSGGAREEDGVPGFDDGPPERDGEMRFSDTG